MNALPASGRLEDWRRAALEPPAALGGPLGSARLKDAAGDFEVRERLRFAADGGSGHRLLEVRKTGRDTLEVARALARHGRLPVREVGFAGMKDRVSVSTQWFSVPASPAAEWHGLAAPGLEVLEVLPHSRKLRRGALAGNGFRIRLREFGADPAAVAARLELIARRGVPNYFGRQRFGRDGSNLEALIAWCEGRGLPAGREPRAFVYSAARALIFNALLAERVRDGSWEEVLPGEFVNLDGRNSYFVAPAPDPALAARLQSHDIHPTGPLAGAGAAPGLEAGAREARLLAAFEPLPALLEAAGLEAARRPLRVRPAGLAFRADGRDLSLEFDLPAGAYATAVLRELAATDAAPTEVSDA